MLDLRDFFKQYDIRPNQYRKVGKAMFVSTNQGTIVVKEKSETMDPHIYEYLDSRSFNYYPPHVGESNDRYEITNYIEEIAMPEEQKMMDMIHLVALLHSKTTHYKEVDEADFKKIYEDIQNNIEYLYSYYTDLISVVETKTMMSPAEYLLARNITKILSSINYSKHELEVWYELVKGKRKQRFVVVHNNLSIDHFIRNKESYLVSWDKAKIDLPIFDLYKLYKRHALDYDFETLLSVYERSYPLLEEERKLLFILISLPDKIEMKSSIYDTTIEISEQVDRLFKTDNLLSPYYAKEKEKYSNYKQTE